MTLKPNFIIFNILMLNEWMCKMAKAGWLFVNQSILARHIISCSGYSGALFVVQSSIELKTDPCHKPRVCLATRAPRCETPVFSQRCTRTLPSHYPISFPLPLSPSTTHL